MCGPASAQANIWMSYLEDGSETEVSHLLLPLASRDVEDLVFLWQCSRGPSVWYLLLCVPGTSTLMAWIWTEAVCLEPAVETPISLFPSFLIIPQFSDHDTGNSYLGWHVWQSFLEAQTGACFPRLPNNFVSTWFVILSPFKFKWARMASFISSQILADTNEAHRYSQPPTSLLYFCLGLFVVKQSCYPTGQW